MVGGMLEAPLPAFAARPLFDHRAVAVATFFGSPMAAGILMAINYRRLGETKAAVLMTSAGIAVTAAVLLLAFEDSSGWTKGLPVGLMLAIMYTAKWLQGPAIEQHLLNGGRLASRWAAFGIGVASLVVVLGVVFAVVYVHSVPKTVAMGPKDEVFCSGGVATRPPTAPHRAS